MNVCQFRVLSRHLSLSSEIAWRPRSAQGSGSYREPAADMIPLTAPPTRSSREQQAAAEPAAGGEAGGREELGVEPDLADVLRVGGLDGAGGRRVGLEVEHVHAVAGDGHEVGVARDERPGGAGAGDGVLEAEVGASRPGEALGGARGLGDADGPEPRPRGLARGGLPPPGDLGEERGAVAG